MKQLKDPPIGEPPTQEVDNNNNNNDPNFDRKLDDVTAAARPFVNEHLLTRITKENCLTIINYILAMQTEVSPSQTYRINTILKLKYFAEFHNSKRFKEKEKAAKEKEESKKRLEELEAKQEILQANATSLFEALILKGIGPVKRP
jgi:hypothetical protein